MTVSQLVVQNLGTILAILGAMAALAIVETLVPLHARSPAHRAHLAPNLALTVVTLVTNIVLNAALLVLLLWLERLGFGLLRWAALGSLAAGAIAVVALDFSYYLLHRAMHRVPALWRLHRLHHSDPVVDVTTTLRQHPAEGLCRYAVMAITVAGLGVGLGAFAVYRAASALVGLLEHANVRIPGRLDRVLVWVSTFPNMHKVHHSRDARETDTNYGNLFSCFDRWFGTYTPSARGETVTCGLG